jgi:hypothetical protein
VLDWHNQQKTKPKTKTKTKTKQCDHKTKRKEMILSRNCMFSSPLVWMKTRLQQLEALLQLFFVDVKLLWTAAHEKIIIKKTKHKTNQTHNEQTNQ